MTIQSQQMIQSVSSQAKKGLLWGTLLGLAMAMVILELAGSMYFSLLGSIVVLFAMTLFGAVVGALIGASIGVDDVEPISNEF